jgi:hypothetical protein
MPTLRGRPSPAVIIPGHRAVGWCAPPAFACRAGFGEDAPD